MYDEQQWHLCEGLEHIYFLREFMRRTGFVDLISELGWAFGYDYDGRGMLEESQLETILRALSDLEGRVEIPDLDQGDWIELRTNTPLSADDKQSILNSIILGIRLSGESEELNMWRHFLQWQCGECLFIRDTSDSGTLGEILFPAFYWFIPLELMSVLEAWEALLKSWEVMTFYGNIADASAWRRLRAGNCVTDDTKRVTAS